LSGSFLLRFADRQFLPLLFQHPPRSTRAEALAVTRYFFYHTVAEMPTARAWNEFRSLVPLSGRR
jgi:hypothetical protein